jgi:hypothetical protein
MSEERFAAADVRALGPDPRIGLLATVAEDGWPHVTLLATLGPDGPRRLVFGQFCEGRSKEHVRREPRAGWFLMTPDRRWWRGRARWTGAERSGPAVDAFNQQPLYRYNAYFGVHTAHHLDLVAVDGRGRLSIARLAAGAALAAAAGVVLRPPPRPAAARGGEPPLGPWVARHLAAPTTLAVLAWIDAEGSPRLVPGVTARPLAGRRLVLAATDAPRDRPPSGAPTAVFALDLKLRSALVSGRVRWHEPPLGPAVGTLDVERVYDPMPPLAGPVWPREPLVAVREF